MGQIVKGYSTAQLQFKPKSITLLRELTFPALYYIEYHCYSKSPLYPILYNKNSIVYVSFRQNNFTTMVTTEYTVLRYLIRSVQRVWSDVITKPRNIAARSMSVIGLCRVHLLRHSLPKRQHKYREQF